MTGEDFVPGPGPGSGILMVAKVLSHRQRVPGFDRLVQVPALPGGHGFEGEGEGGVALDVLQARHADARQADRQG